MHKQRYTLTFIVLFSFMLLIPGIYNQNGPEIIVVNERANDDVSNFVTSTGPSLDPMMLIEYEANFSDYGWTGDGSADSPYTLEDQTYIHDGSYSYFIEIRDTRSNFTIKNCNFYGSPSYYALYFINVTNGVISGNTFENCHMAAYLSISTGIEIKYNTISDVTYGVYVTNSPFTNFSYNTVDDYSYDGVLFSTGSSNGIY